MKKINRRDFLKITGIGTAALSIPAAFAGIVPINVRGRNVSIFTSKFRKGIHTICDVCPARCGVIGFLRYDEIVAIQGNPYHINNKGKICARGIAGINQVYDPERILHPMKRLGKRGEHNWKQITWDQALKEIADRLKKIKQSGEEKNFVFQSDPHRVRGLGQRFLKNFGKPTMLSGGNYQDLNRLNANKKMWGVDRGIVDAENSCYFLIFGANPFESHPDFVSFNQRLISAKIKKHAKLVTIDPRLSNTAGRSDEWLPIKPGTDAIVALAMANVILKNQLADEEFVQRYTDVSIDQLKSYLAQFTVEKAAEESTLEASKIEEIALEFAEKQPGVAITGGGITDHINGVENERAVMLLNVLVGNIDREGGVCLPRSLHIENLSLDEISESAISDFAFFEAVAKNQESVDLYFAFKNNPVYEYPNCDMTRQVFENEQLMPFVVVMDNVMSETAALADIVLPATTFVESWDLDSSPSYDMKPFVALSQPVIKAQGESLSLDDFCLSLASRLGGSMKNSLNWQNSESYYKHQIKNSRFISDRKKLFEEGICCDHNLLPDFEIYKSDGFTTPSGRFEIMGSSSDGRSLPAYQPIQENISLEKNELVLLPHKVHVMRNDLSNLKWLAEIHHKNAAVINSKTARRLRIKSGDYIILESKVGKTILKADLSEGVHPAVIAISEGLGHWEYGKIALSKRFKSEDPDTNFLWWEDHGNGSHPYFIIPVATDENGKGQGWNDTKIQISKA